MNEPLPVDWTAIVDPYQTFTNLAKIESRLKQLADPAVSHNDEDMERVADVYAKSKIDILIEKKKAMLESGTAKSYNEEWAEYKMAYDAYHSENGESMIAMMSGDTKKAYNISGFGNYSQDGRTGNGRARRKELSIRPNGDTFMAVSVQNYSAVQNRHCTFWGKHAEIKSEKATWRLMIKGRVYGYITLDNGQMMTQEGYGVFQILLGFMISGWCQTPCGTYGKNGHSY